MGHDLLEYVSVISFRRVMEQKRERAADQSKNSTGELDTRKGCKALEKAERRGEWFKGMPLSRNMYRNVWPEFGSDRRH